VPFRHARALAADPAYAFLEDSPRQLEDLNRIAARFAPDAVLCDSGLPAALFLHEQTTIPLAVLNYLPVTLSSADAAPFGFRMRPGASIARRLRNGLLNWAAEHVIFRDLERRWRELRAEVGLPPAGRLADAFARASLYLQAGVPGFEYPRRDLPRNVRFVGALPGSAPSGWRPPSWWHELEGSRPVVHVASDRPALVEAATAGLSSEDVLVVVSTNGKTVDDLGLKLPSNARLEPFPSYPDLLPLTSAMVTGGGFGGVQAALSHGVPVVAAGTAVHERETAARVAWSGAGIDLGTGSPRPNQVRDAVRAVLDKQLYSGRARELQAEFAQYDAAGGVCACLERLTGAGAQPARARAS
jgi:UDP:flavonoid glycosyltransferase YjiC (YdhE family)